MCVNILGSRRSYSVLTARTQCTNWEPVLADVVVLVGFWDRDDYRFVLYVRYLSS